MKHKDPRARYLKVMVFATKWLTKDGKLVFYIDGKPSRWNVIEMLATEKYLTDQK